MEVRAIGTTDQKNADDLLLFLGSLAGYKPKPLDIHTIVMNIEGSGRKQLHLVNYIIPNTKSKKSNSWVAIQYAAPLLGDLKLATLPATVSTVTQSQCNGPDVPGFWSSLGFTREYQHYKKGWTCDIQHDSFLIHLIIYRLYKVADIDPIYSTKTSFDSSTLGEHLIPSQIVIEAWSDIDSNTTTGSGGGTGGTSTITTTTTSTAVGNVMYIDAIQSIQEIGLLLEERFGITLQALPKQKR